MRYSQWKLKVDVKSTHAKNCVCEICMKRYIEFKVKEYQEFKKELK